MTRTPVEPGNPPALLIRFKKLREGGHTFACVRADGTSTWQRQPNISPQHDLTHYAVETVLGFRKGFYGLVADGWNLSDFGAPWPRGRIPADADPAELIVGFFDVERTMHQQMTAADFMASAASYYREHGGHDPAWQLTDGQLSDIRSRMEELFGQWRALGLDDTLELSFRPEGARTRDASTVLGTARG